MKNILLIVDPQNDFITGTLPVEGAEAKMEKLADYIKARHAEYDYILVTMDSHPTNHSSFKDNGGIWPEHCVMWSDGWNIPEYVNDALDIHPHVAFYHKGDIQDTEEYSIFDSSEDGFTLANQLRKLIEEGEIYVDICGIAGDYCVLETLKGLRKLVPDECISILFDFTASIDGGEKLFTYAKENQINIIEDSSINLTEYVR